MLSDKTSDPHCEPVLREVLGFYIALSHIEQIGLHYPARKTWPLICQYFFNYFQSGGKNRKSHFCKLQQFARNGDRHMRIRKCQGINTDICLYVAVGGISSIRMGDLNSTTEATARVWSASAECNDFIYPTCWPDNPAPAIWDVFYPAFNQRHRFYCHLSGPIPGEAMYRGILKWNRSWCCSFLGWIGRAIKDIRVGENYALQLSLNCEFRLFIKSFAEVRQFA